MRRLSRIGIGIAVGICASIAATPAQATMPGTNGKIAVAAGCNLWVMNPDGTQEQQITFEPCGSATAPRNPEWSPDGTKISYDTWEDVYVINADGSGQTNITNTPHPVIEYYSSWSPDGTRIAFTRYGHNGPGGPSPEIFMANPDGTDQTLLETGMCRSYAPVWHPDGRIFFQGYTYTDCNVSQTWIISPDGTGLTPLAVNPYFNDVSPDGSQVTFDSRGTSAEIFTQGIDGSEPIRLTNDSAYDNKPHWAPDGTKLVFLSDRDGARDTPYIMNADGSGVSQVSTRGAQEVSWQPIPVNAYPRPKGASPTDVSLVPAYQPCTSPNSTHGPPLASGSCNPPVQEPGDLTVGTPDANGQGAKSVSNLRINPLRGDPTTPADEADVRLRANINDVRLRSDLSDYTGSLEVRLSIQITDKDNTPHPGGPGPATVQEFTHSHPLPCAATPDTTVGSTCQFDTTLEALVPGAV